MQTPRYIPASLLTLFLAASVSFAVYMDTGDYNLYYQPNSATFYAHTWGDEFGWWSETDAGYSIILNPNDQYYYYAQLDTNGDFTWTDLKVAIDDPTGLPLHLDRSQARKDQLTALQEQFMLDCEAARQQFIAWQDTSTRDFLNVAVILTAFTDQQPCTQNFFKFQFEDMLNSDGYYNTYLNRRAFSLS